MAVYRDGVRDAASTTAPGLVELATDAETVTGTDATKAVTPAGATAKMSAPGAIGDTTPATGNFTDVELVHTAPYLTLHNSTHEDGNGGRESRIDFKGEQSGGEETTLGRVEVSHSGASDDEKGQFTVALNDGNDGDTPTERFRLTSDGDIGVGTPDPDTPFHILRANGTAVLRLERNDTGIVIDDVYGAVEFEGQDSSSNADGVRAQMLGIADDNQGGVAVVFKTASGSSSTLTERLRISSDGDVNIATGTLTEKYTITIDNTDGVDTYTAVQMLGKLIRRGTGNEITGAVIDVTDTAANIVAAIPGCTVGSGFEFAVNNEDSTHTIQVDGGTGVTMSPNDPSTAIAANSSGRFLVEVTNATASSEAVTVHCIGITVH